MAWVKAASLDALHSNPVVFNHPPRQISLFKIDDRVYAIDNRCPHEGYPLAVGSVEDGVVTCNWHNWKFRLRDGECLLGGDHVRSYPTRLEDGHAWVDIADPPPEKVAARFFEVWKQLSANAISAEFAARSHGCTITVWNRRMRSWKPSGGRMTDSSSAQGTP